MIAMGCNAAMTYLMMAIFNQLFMLRVSLEFFATEQNSVPKFVFQLLFLSLLTVLLLPLFFKAYGSAIFGTYGIRLNKGFDQAVYR
jgi:hypothetical protein